MYIVRHVLCFSCSFKCITNNFMEDLKCFDVCAEREDDFHAVHDEYN